MIGLIAIAALGAWVWRIVLIFLVLTIVYAALTFISRMRQKDRLKAEFKRAETESSKEDFMNEGMAKYNKSLRAKLILSVYLIPLAALSLLIFLALNE